MNSSDSSEESPPIDEFQEKIVDLETPEEKIAQGLSFMRGAISQEGTPRFREFWEVRHLVLPFFKENLNPIARSKLWSEYVELTVEVRRLKEILEEQSAFAMEQIDLAIQALQEDFSNFESLLTQMEDVIFPRECPTIQQKKDFYNQLQRELYLFNTLASRLTALRKEILKTDMRVRFKTRFFKILSELGDQIFPKRKELIEKVSFEFEKDVEHFTTAHFKEGQVVGAPYYALKEEIKALQNMAKVFTLNSSVFNRTRLRLSACWDQIKVFEKERKKVVLERRQTSILQHQANDEKQKLEEERLRLKREKIGAFKEKIASLLKESDLEILTLRHEELKKEIDTFELSKGEKQQLERHLRPLKDFIADRKEQALLNLSDDEKKMLENLQVILDQKKERRKEIKEQMEIYRKALGGSGLDFEKAMLYRELVDQEKERLVAADLAIVEVEQKIAELE